MKNGKHQFLVYFIKEDTKKNGERCFLHLSVFKKNKEGLLLKNDSIYAAFLEKANLRFKR